jgi:hypothetical protein
MDNCCGLCRQDCQRIDINRADIMRAIPGECFPLLYVVVDRQLPFVRLGYSQHYRIVRCQSTCSFSTPMYLGAFNRCTGSRKPVNHRYGFFTSPIQPFGRQSTRSINHEFFFPSLSFQLR